MSELIFSTFGPRVWQTLQSVEEKKVRVAGAVEIVSIISESVIIYGFKKKSEF